MGKEVVSQNASRMSIYTTSTPLCDDVKLATATDAVYAVDFTLIKRCQMFELDAVLCSLKLCY